MALLCRYCDFRIVKFISPKIFPGYSSSPYIIQWSATMTTDAFDKINILKKNSRSNHSKSNNGNVDKEDVIKHGSIEDWWDIKGSMKGLHAMNELRLELIFNGLLNTGRLSSVDVAEYLNGVKIIEVGCGGGILCEPLARLGAEVTGVDPSEELITLAKTHANDNLKNIKHLPRYISTTVEDHAVENTNVYDALVASEVIEHVPDKRIFLEACVKTVKPGGSLFFTTPNRTTVSWLGAIVIAENVLKLLPKGIHQWDKFITPVELKHMLEQLGCTTYLVNGMVYEVLKNKWYWTKIQKLHYALHAVKLNQPVNK